VKSFMDYWNLCDFISDFPTLDITEMYLGLVRGATLLEYSHGFDYSCASCCGCASLRLTTLGVSYHFLTPSAYRYGVGS
jgi:hypothetical protein